MEGIISVDGIVGHLEEDTEHAFTYFVGYDYVMTSQAHLKFLNKAGPRFLTRRDTSSPCVFKNWNSCARVMEIVLTKVLTVM